MRIFLALCACVVSGYLGGCGVKFLDRDINIKLSQEMLGTSVFKDTEILKRHLEEIPGYIVIEDSAGNLVPAAPLQPQGYTPAVTPISDEQAFYHSVIDSTAGAQGSYLSILSADLDVKSKADVTIAETAEAFIPRENVPWTQIAAWGRAHPPAVAGQKRYNIQGALLSTVSKTIYVEISSSATVEGGAAFGASGKVYATDKQTQTSHFAFIGTHLLDVDAIAQNPPGNAEAIKSLDHYLVHSPKAFNTLKLQK